ncbi:MAG: 7-cyano-7-deazaguanine synthase QueC [Gemmataceae bacterium]|nr:7-cyano-7-deazaguanine synthase QueC [Gemmataceae bacterium]
MKCVVILSGGLDSATVLYTLKAEGHEVRALTVDYGQRHRRELDAARALCRHAGVEQRVVDLSTLAPLFGENRLTAPRGAVPEGPYTAGTIALTTVPNRNMILLAIALGWAIALRYDAVTFGAHQGPHANYPDCRPEFAEVMDRAARLCDAHPVRILAPFIHADKAAVVAAGHRAGVPFELTWSCYQGGARHCGRCGTCLDRLEAFRRNGLTDPVAYEPAARP